MLAPRRTSPRAVAQPLADARCLSDRLARGLARVAAAPPVQQALGHRQRAEVVGRRADERARLQLRHERRQLAALVRAERARAAARFGHERQQPPPLGRRRASARCPCASLATSAADSSPTTGTPRARRLTGVCLSRNRSIAYVELCPRSRRAKPREQLGDRVRAIVEDPLQVASARTARAPARPAARTAAHSARVADHHRVLAVALEGVRVLPQRVRPAQLHVDEAQRRLPRLDARAPAHRARRAASAGSRSARPRASRSRRAS